LRGIHFHKGCYLGQELTARTFHTGTQHKRVLPIYTTAETLETDTEIFPAAAEEQEGKRKKSLGKVCSTYKNIALAKVRVKEALESSHLMCGDKEIKVVLPDWLQLKNPS